MLVLRRPITKVNPRKKIALPLPFWEKRLKCLICAVEKFKGTFRGPYLHHCSFLHQYMGWPFEFEKQIQAHNPKLQ